VLKENETRTYGEYRTRRLVLAAWDHFAQDGTFDPALLRDPRQFDAVQKALVETRGRVSALEAELEALLARSDATLLPPLFVEGESDVAILSAAWRAFYPTEPLPVAILAAGGTRQMESLAGRAPRCGNCSATGWSLRSPTTTAKAATSSRMAARGAAVSGADSRMASIGACWHRPPSSSRR
jgi:hypothetical protein